MGKFTKGKWYASQIKIDGKAIGCTWSVGVGGHLIADVTSGPTFGIVNDIQKANAYLMATAPDMYTFIESLQLSVSDNVRRDELLAKARGD